MAKIKYNPYLDQLVIELETEDLKEFPSLEQDDVEVKYDSDYKVLRIVVRNAYRNGLKNVVKELRASSRTNSGV